MIHVRQCPKCGVDTNVVDSREKPEGIWRRRACPKCGCRFNTIEIPLEIHHERNSIERKAIQLIKLIKKEMQDETINHNPDI